MLRRKRLIDPDQVERERATARKAAEELAVEKRKVQDSNSAIMGEVREHRRLLGENNFAEKFLRALGGAEG